MFDPRASRRFKKNRGAVVGAALVVALVSFAVFGPMFAGHDPNLSDFSAGRDSTGGLLGPSSQHLLGVDPLLRDSFSRLAMAPVSPCWLPSSRRPSASWWALP